MEQATRNPSAEFERVPVRPGQCLEQGWSLVRDQYWLFLGIALVGMLIGGAFPLLLMGPMMCGIYICFLQKLRGEPVQFETLFRGFDHFVQSLVATLVTMGASFLVIFPVVMVGIALIFFGVFSMAEMQDASGCLVLGGSIALFYLLIFAAALIVGTVFLFAYPLIADRGLGGWEAVTASARAVWANFRGVLGLVLLESLLSLAGVMACYVGVFLVMPVVLGATAVAYRKIFPAPAAAQSSPPPVQPADPPAL